jgi:isopentenyl-diphosphate delta-isomerase
MDTATRKDRHLDACLSGDVEAGGGNGLDAWRFDHQALPGIDLDEVDTRATLLGRDLAWPFVIGAMTGGTPRGAAFNDALARAAAATGCGLALGSMRAALEDGAAVAGFDVRSRVPGVPLVLGNVGVSHAGPPHDDAVLAACRRLGLDALVVHLNPLQEAVQGGDVAYRGAEDRLAALAARLRGELGVRLVVKEVGSGLSQATLRRLAAARPDAVETAGTGGTSWARVEARLTADPVRARCGETFAAWGHPLADSLRWARQELPGTAVIASGGLRTGLDLAKAIRLGAAAGAMAGPLLRAAERGPETLARALSATLLELRVAMFLTGSRTIAELRAATIRGTDGQPLPDAAAPTAR